MQFTVPLATPFSLEYTLASGQVFRWKRRGEWWYGDVRGGVVKVRQEEEGLRCESSGEMIDGNFVSSYFRLDDDLEHILATIAKDRIVTEAVERLYGLRLIRQERWECLGSFLLATNANIPRIEKMVAEVCKRYGSMFEFEGEAHYAFPTPDSLAEATVSGLTACGLGYRATFLHRVAASVVDGRIDLDGVASLPYSEAKEVLLRELIGEKILPGVGPKVADCVLLYSCGKDEAFPIDVWIARVIAKSYPRLLAAPLRAKLGRDDKAKISPADYSSMSESLRRYFGKYAGYAQQYLYLAARVSVS